MQRPKVSIGLPVYNGHKYLALSLDSLLAQTYTDFELIICDNHSTDETAEICREYAARDPRIRYFRNAETIGAADNGNRTFRLAVGEYFRWAADDDLVAPTLLEQCVDVLDRDASVVLCHSEVAHIDADGNLLRTVRRGWPPGVPTWRRFAVITHESHCEETYGLMRRDALAVTGLEHNYTDSDRVLLAHMSLLGQFHEIPEVLFSKRFHPDMSTQLYPDWRDRMRMYGEQYGERITLPHWTQLGHYLQVIAGSPVGATTKARCFAWMAGWTFTERRWRYLGKDVLLALVRLARRLRPGPRVTAIDHRHVVRGLDATCPHDDLAPTAAVAADGPRVAVVLSSGEHVSDEHVGGASTASIRAQTYPNIRLVAVADHGTDTASAWNAGFDALDDEVAYVLFLEVGDVLERHAVATLVAYLEANPEAVAAYGVPTLVDEQGEVLGQDAGQVRWVPAGPGRHALADHEPVTPLASIVAGTRVLPSATLVRRSAFDQTAGWDQSLTAAEPSGAGARDLAIQLSLAGPIHRFFEPLVRHRPRPGVEGTADLAKQVDRKWWDAPLRTHDRRAVRGAIRFAQRVAMVDAARSMGARQ